MLKYCQYLYSPHLHPHLCSFHTVILLIVLQQHMGTEFVPVNVALFGHINFVKQLFIFLSHSFVEYNGEDFAELINIKAELPFLA